MNEDFVSFYLAKKLKEKNFIGDVEIGLQCGFYYKDVEEENMLYKHINEKYVKRKINNQ